MKSNSNSSQRLAPVKLEDRSTKRTHAPRRAVTLSGGGGVNFYSRTSLSAFASAVPSAEGRP